MSIAKKAGIEQSGRFDRICYNSSMLQRNINSNIRNDTFGNAKKASGSIAHAADILTCLSDDIHTVTDIARRCGLGKSTVHRVLKLLERPMLVVQDTVTRHYYLGPLITRLASNPVTTHEYLILCAGEEMNRLAQLSEETVALDIMIGTQIFPLYEVPSQHDFRVTREGRASGPLHAGASGKVLLSLLNEKQLRTAIASIELVRVTDRTVIDPDRLLAQVREIRQQGYAVSRGERIDGVMCISVPIKNYSLPVVMSIVGPESRLEPKAAEAIAQMTISARRISESAASILSEPVK
jgi:DNA-binding IclR family transcriptional regulator